MKDVLRTLLLLPIPFPLVIAIIHHLHPQQRLGWREGRVVEASLRRVCVRRARSLSTRRQRGRRTLRKALR